MAELLAALEHLNTEAMDALQRGDTTEARRLLEGTGDTLAMAQGRPSTWAERS